MLRRNFVRVHDEGKPTECRMMATRPYYVAARVPRHPDRSRRNRRSGRATPRHRGGVSRSLVSEAHARTGSVSTSRNARWNIIAHRSVLQRCSANCRMTHSALPLCRAHDATARAFQVDAGNVRATCSLQSQLSFSHCLSLYRKSYRRCSTRNDRGIADRVRLVLCSRPRALRNSPDISSRTTCAACQ